MTVVEHAIAESSGNVHTAAINQSAEEGQFLLSYVWIKVLTTCEGTSRDSVPAFIFECLTLSHFTVYEPCFPCEGLAPSPREN